MIDRGTGGAAPRNTRAKSVISPGTRTATPYIPKKTQKNQLKLSANAEVLRKPLGGQVGR